MAFNGGEGVAGSCGAGGARLAHLTARHRPTAPPNARHRPTFGAGSEIDLLDSPDPIRTTAFGKSSTHAALNFPNGDTARGFGDLSRFVRGQLSSKRRAGRDHGPATPSVPGHPLPSRRSHQRDRSPTHRPQRPPPPGAQSSRGLIVDRRQRAAHSAGLRGGCEAATRPTLLQQPLCVLDFPNPRRPDWVWQVEQVSFPPSAAGRPPAGGQDAGRPRAGRGAGHEPAVKLPPAECSG
jgi:hypothetical protein